MKQEKAVQIFQMSSELPKIDNAQSLAKVRSDAEHYPHYGNVTQKSRVAWLTLEIRRLASLMRLSDYGVKDASLAASALDTMIARNDYMADLTQPEIEESFTNGVFGEYGQFMGLTAMTLYQFLREYIESEKKKEAAKILLDRASKNDQEITDFRAKCRKEMEEAKKNGSFVPTGNAWYKPQTINSALSSSEHRERVKQQAEQILKNSQI